jgi:uncharacterized membrane-anchored protein
VTGTAEQHASKIPEVTLVFWIIKIAATTLGETGGDTVTMTLNWGYLAGTALFLSLLALFVFLQIAAKKFYPFLYWATIVASTTAEAFYWVAITFSQTLGTALGDWTADDTGLGYDGGALLFAAGLAILAAAYFWTKTSRVFLFWGAFILTRPLGATVGDFLDKPMSDGGLALSRPIASAVIGAFIIVCILVLPQRAGRHPGQSETAT